jgi:hypothetical protein
MSQSEYILGFVAILIGIALADIAQSLHKLLRARARVRWHWLPLAAATLLILLTVELWWSLTSLERLPGALTIGTFLPLLVGLFILFLLASAVLPDEVPAEGVDLRAFYFAEQRYFWLLFAFFVASFIILQLATAWFFRGADAIWKVLSSIRPNLLFIGLALSLAYIRRPVWHQLWLALLPIILLVGMFTRRLM